MDSVAHRVALENYKSTIFVLPEGILRFKPRKEFNNFFNTDNALVISEFAPGMIWASHNAMLRNRTIIGLSDAMIVVEAGLKGGTMDAGLSAIELGRPVFSPVYNGSSGEGNAVLIKKGVAPFYRKKSTGKADISKIIHAIKAPIKPEFEKQDDLF